MPESWTDGGPRRVAGSCSIRRDWETSVRADAAQNDQPPRPAPLPLIQFVFYNPRMPVPLHGGRRGGKHDEGGGRRARRTSYGRAREGGWRTARRTWRWPPDQARRTIPSRVAPSPETRRGMIRRKHTCTRTAPRGPPPRRGIYPSESAPDLDPRPRPNKSGLRGSQGRASALQFSDPRQTQIRREPVWISGTRRRRIRRQGRGARRTDPQEGVRARSIVAQVGAHEHEVDHSRHEPRPRLV